jgi:GT2 family glycosyltransferase
MSKPSHQPPTVVAVVVTHNRLALLKENLAALRGQTRTPEEIIVVNNGSTDGTAEWLATQPDLTVIQEKNVGPGGGQSAGIKTAYTKGYDWFWCMDDDAIPDRDALEQHLKSSKASDERTGFLYSFVRWTDGSVCLMTAPNVHPDYSTLVELLPQGLLRLDSASWNSILFHRRAVAKIGLPLREMFFWFEDVEYTRRISNNFLCYQVLASKAEHRSKTNRWVNFDKLAELPADFLQNALRNFIFLRRWQAPSKAIGWFRCVKSALRMQWRVWRQIPGMNKWPLSAAIWRGVVFHPKIEMPE